MKRLLFISAVLLCGCPTSTTKNSDTEEVHVAAMGEELARVSADLDGDGKSDTMIVSERLVTVGPVKVDVDYSYEPETDASYEAKVIDIDPKDKKKEVLLIESDGMDGLSHTVFTYDGKQIVASDLGWTMASPDIKDGMLTLTDSNCGETTTKMYALSGTKVALKDEKKTGEFKDEMCAACPYVFVQTGEGLAFEGEILRSLRGSERHALQSLPLRRLDAGSGPIVVRLAEHKPETTSLDQIYVTVNGVVIPEASCVMDPAGAWCQADGRHVEITRGESVDLRFDVPVHTRDTHVVLWAYGYYEPL